MVATIGLFTVVVVRRCVVGSSRAGDLRQGFSEAKRAEPRAPDLRCEAGFNVEKCGRTHGGL